MAWKVYPQADEAIFLFTIDIFYRNILLQVDSFVLLPISPLHHRL